MMYLLTHYWIWLAAAFVVGAATPLVANKLGWAADLENYWLSRIGVALAVLVVLILVQVASGKAELLLEVGTALVIAYIAGGVADGIAPGLLPGRFQGWWVGLFATALILAVFGITTLPKLEPDLRERVAEVVKAAGADPLNFDVAGRDVLLPADIATDKARAELGHEILKVPGVRLVTDVEDLTGPALAAKTIAKLQAEAEAKAKADAEAKLAAEKEAAAKDTAAKHAAAKAKAETEAKEAAAKAAADAAAKEAAAKEAAAKETAAKAAVDEVAKQAAAAKPVAAAAPIQTANAAGAVPETPAQACQARVTAVVAAEKINFERGSAEIEQASQPVLTKLAAAIAQCPAVTIEVAGHTDAAGKKAANTALSKRRAEAVVDGLTKAGIGSAKLVAAGYGSAKPIAANDTAEGRAQNRRIEFVVK